MKLKAEPETKSENTLIYRCVTANCGNGTLGPEGSSGIITQLISDKADCYVLNCQEVAYNKTLSELNNSLIERQKDSPYAIKILGSMSTMTKMKDLLSSPGMATFIIYDREKWALGGSNITEVRRQGNANKGGLITNVFLESRQKPESIISLQTVSAHLDSKAMNSRAEDWYNIHASLALSKTEISDFEQLAQATPNVRVSGYDANTRNRIGQAGKPEGNIWTNGANNNNYEVGEIKFAPLGTMYGADSTYKSYIEGCLVNPSTKRPGYVDGGPLDQLAIQDGQEPAAEIIFGGGTIVIHPVAEQKRDHAVVISPLMSYASTSAFENTKNHMSAMLARAAPNLANDLRNMVVDNPKNRGLLVDIYKAYLSKEGLLLKELALFKKKLNVMAVAFKEGPDAEAAVKNRLFGANKDGDWFGDVGLDNCIARSEVIEKRQADETNQINNKKAQPGSATVPASTLGATAPTRGVLKRADGGRITTDASERDENPKKEDMQSDSSSDSSSVRSSDSSSDNDGKPKNTPPPPEGTQAQRPSSLTGAVPRRLFSLFSPSEEVKGTNVGNPGNPVNKKP